MGPAIKVFTETQWHDLQANGRFDGSADDKRDGFIHLSYRDQLFGTITKYFDDEHRIVLAVLTPRDPDLLKDEVSRDGALFPHYFTHITKAEMGAAVKLERKSVGFKKQDLLRALTELGVA